MKKGLRPMDLLKSALAERQAKAQKTIAETGQKWVKRSELEAKRMEEYFADQRREEEKLKADEEAKMKRLEEHFTKSGQKDQESKKEIPAHLLDEALLQDDDAEPPMPLEDIVSRFRQMGQPIILFGETDMQRYKRMRQLEREDHEGKKNPDLVMLEAVHANSRTMIEDQTKDKDDEDEDEEEGEKKKEGEEEDEKSEASESEEEKDSEKDSEKESGQDDLTGDEKDGAAKKEGEGGEAPKDKPKEEAVEVPEVDLGTMDQCDMIRSWVRKSLKAWEKELADLPDEEKKKPSTKTAVAAHRQVRRDVRPLQKRLRMYRMEEWLLEKIYNIVKKADDREYREAAEAYLDLTIGKAAWPVGIGCGGSMLMEDAIGLHDRFNRNNQVKDVAYALNDEVTRKFVQALKRLMNAAQKYWPPADPSKKAN